MNKLKVGIAGYGVVGKRRHYHIDLNPHLKVVAVCDRIFSNPDERGPDVIFFSDYQKLLEQDLDILFVSLTNDMAAEVTMAGLNRGLHVFCEKPPGRNLNDMIQVAHCKKKYSDLVLKYGFNHRYHDSVSEALRLIDSQDLGKVINLRGVYGKSKIVSFDKNISSWRSKRAMAGGGILLDQGIHMVDLLRLFAGEFIEVHSFVSNDFWKHDVEDNAYALMRTKDRKVAILHSSATQWRHCFQLDICLEKGTISLSGILSGSKSYGAEKLTVAWATENDSGDPKEQTIRYNEDKSWEYEIAEFANAIVHSAPVVHGTIEDAYKTMLLVTQIYNADKEWAKRWELEPLSQDLLSFEYET